MMTIENPSKHLSYIQQCLSSDKKPLGLFLGAGCPTAIRVGPDGKEPLIPDIAGMTKIIRDELTKSEDCGPLIKVVERHFEEDERDDTTVEDMLTHIRALRAVAGKAEVRGLSAEQLDKLDETICQLIHRVADRTLPNAETPYHRIASWVDAVGRESPVEVFTTNYDLSMEQAFEDSRVPYFDGFAGARKPLFNLRAMEEDMLPPRWSRLWKLHGSINWYQTEDKGVFRGSTAEDEGVKRVIHPSHLKYEESRRMPYLAMIDRLRAFLKQATSTLVLCGFSFRDDHINEVIVQGLQGSQTAMAFALLHDKIAKYPQAMTLASRCSNLSILARDGAVISARESRWPEKDPGAVMVSDSPGVKWTPLDPADKESKRAAQFILGDFAVFGQFLQELVGDVRQRREVPNAQ